MKKNLFLKLASGLLVLCLASTCAIGTTFAKYVTGDSASDTARVAKWGIDVSTSGTLFGSDYEKHSTADTADRIVAATSVSVSALDGANIVAPGTMNTIGFQVKITGQPEVAYDVSAKTESSIEDIWLAKGSYAVMVRVPDDTAINVATKFAAEKIYKGNETTGAFEKLDAYVALSENEHYYRLVDAVEVTEDRYYPIQWGVSVKGSTVAYSTNLNTVVSTMVGYFNEDARDGNAENSINETYTLTWKWEFEVDDTTNKKDTILGNIIAAEAGQVVVVTTDSGANYTKVVDQTNYNIDVKFDISVNVVQVD
ncbi:MAG: hypothetical protein IJX28_07310 [Clostridia bacterium]|nr:hypothetical protein [Clostridia bacterium]